MKGPFFGRKFLMIAIKRILCPTDLSEDTARTLRYAVALARTYEAQLFVCNRPQSSTTEAHKEVVNQVKSLVDAALSIVSDAAAQSRDVVWSSIVLEDQDIGAAITDTAAEISADLILMRSRRRPLAATLLGSTAERIAHKAPCPVLVMHADEREWMDESTGEIRLQRLLVPLDFSTYSELALQYGLALAQQYQADVHLLHVLPMPVSEPEISWVGADKNAPYQQAAHRLQSAVPPEVHLWCTVKHAVQTGRVYKEVLGYATENEIDLICMGAHGSDFTVTGLLGSNVDRVLRQAQCPVLIAHPR